MSKFKCECRTILSFGRIPNPDEWLLISDKEYDNFQGKIDSEELYSRCKCLIKCPSCNRVWIFWNGFNNKPELYQKV